MEKFFIVACFNPDHPFTDGGIALIRDSQTGEKEILVIGPGCDGLFVEDWPSQAYSGIVKNGERVDLDDAVWDVALRVRETKKGDSKREEREAYEALEQLIGTELLVRVHLGGVLR